eukprot:5190123-Karenia_brevis.AAC.1
MLPQLQQVQTVDSRNVENRIVESRSDTGIKKAVLDEKDFRRMDNIEGDQKMFRSWMFNLGVAI